MADKIAAPAPAQLGPALGQVGMNSESAEQFSELPLLAIERWATVAAQDRKFWVALALAALMHAAFLIGIVTRAPRHVGEADGADDAISISVVTEADLQSRSTVPEAAEPPPGPPVTAEPQQAPQPQQTPPQPPEPEAAPPQPKAEPQDALAPSFAEEIPDLLAIPDQGPPPAKKAQAARPQQKRTAKLDLSPPPPALNAPAGGGGRSAGFARPPGITRSGANDDFARNVIRELQKTMPQLRDTLGRVTVRIILNDNGNVVEVAVINPSTTAGLDQNVVFAAKQTSYPFPPPNSNAADRTFYVTYIYR